MHPDGVPPPEIERILAEVRAGMQSYRDTLAAPPSLICTACHAPIASPHAAYYRGDYDELVEIFDVWFCSKEHHDAWLASTD